MQAMMSALRVEIATAEDQVQRYGAALASASKALDLATDALAEINQNIRSVELAGDYITVTAKRVRWCVNWWPGSTGPSKTLSMSPVRPIVVSNRRTTS